MARSSPPIKPHSSNSKALQKNYAPQKPKCKSWNYVHFHDFLIDINVTLPSRHLQTYEMISAAVCNFFQHWAYILTSEFRVNRISTASMMPHSSQHYSAVKLIIGAVVQGKGLCQKRQYFSQARYHCQIQTCQSFFLCVTQSIQISIPYGGLPRKTDKSIIRSLRTQLKYYKYIEFLRADNIRALR